MNKDLVDNLLELGGDLYSPNDEDPENSPFKLFDFELNGDGWYEILVRFTKQMRAWMVVKQRPVKILQIKEKFGGLRIYLDAVDDGAEALDNLSYQELDGIIRQAEEESFTICYYCGGPGKLQSIRGWVITICDPCRVERIRQ